MRILIISFFFPPELTPRAFRTFELIREYCETGHSVVLLLPRKPEYQDPLFQHRNLKIIYIESHLEHKIVNNQTIDIMQNNFKKRINGRLFIKLKSIKSRIEKVRTRIDYYFFQINNKYFISNLFKFLKNENDTYDLLISICWPIETHIGTAMGLIFNKNLRKIKIKVAEYSDPFSTEQKIKIFWGYMMIDFIIGKMFDYIVVPTSVAVSSYKFFKDPSYIKIIPQAFNLSEYSLEQYVPNKIPTFAYAGTFYFGSRNPLEFIKNIANKNIPFKLIIYAIRESYDTQLIIQEIKDILHEKVEIYFNIDRKQLIKELSKMDFLLNFDYTTTNQTPSKLIDYAIAKRPICSISTKDLEFDKFEEFLRGNYENQVSINVGDYDISIVAKQFLNLASEV